MLRQPLLYLSHYLKMFRTEYYDRLMAVRETGDWEGWLRFFLDGVASTAEEAAATASAIVALRERHRALIQDEAGINGLRLLDMLFRRPLVNVNLVAQELGVVFATANRLVEQLERAGLLKETTGGQRNRRYRYAPYLALFADQDLSPPDQAPTQTTISRT